MKKKAETKKCAKAVKAAEAKGVKIAKQGSVLLERTDKVVTRDKKHGSQNLRAELQGERQSQRGDERSARGGDGAPGRQGD